MLMTEDGATFAGRYYRLEGATYRPRPMQRPHPPIWIGGSGEQRTLRIVAEHADVWNFAGGPVEMAIHKAEVLERHCAGIGRDPNEIRRSVQVRFSGDDLDGILRELDGFVAAGFTELVVIVTEPDSLGKAETVAREIVPRFRD